MIKNSGFYQAWTIDTLIRDHSSQPYNPSVARAFFLAGMIESWGSLSLKSNVMYPLDEEQRIDIYQDAFVAMYEFLKYKKKGDPYRI